MEWKVILILNGQRVRLHCLRLYASLWENDTTHLINYLGTQCSNDVLVSIASFKFWSVQRDALFFHLPEKEHLCRGIALPVHGRSTLLSKISHFWIQKPKMVNGLAFESATRNNSKRFALVTLTHSKTQSYTGGRGCHASCQPAHQEQLGFHYLAQGYLDMQPGQSGDLTTDLTISGWLVPPPESQLPLLDYYLLWLVP